MPSSPREPSRGSLLTRETLVAAMSSAGGGLAAAVCAAVVADRVIDASEDRRLRDHGRALLDEIASLPIAAAQHETADEARELADLGLRLAVYEQGQFFGGDPALVHGTPGCSVFGDGARQWRRCAVERAPRTAIVASPVNVAGRSWITFGLAAFAAVLSASILGAVVSRRTAQWAVAPLTRLAARVSSTRSGVPDLGAPEGVLEVDELRLALASAWSRLDVALSTARRFSADAAHELRTPLTAISGELELLEERVADETMRDEVRRARTNVKRLARLMERLLVLARSSEADALSGGDAVVLAELVETSVAQLAPNERSRVEIEARSPGTLRGDESLLGAMVENAIHNALHHGRDAVKVSISEVDGVVSFDVRDEGPGVPQDERERLFEPFARGRDKAGHEGHGIGLALIAHVARAHGGGARFVDAARGAHLQVVVPPWAPREATR